VTWLATVATRVLHCLVKRNAPAYDGRIAHPWQEVQPFRVGRRVTLATNGVNYVIKDNMRSDSETCADPARD
jgi:hypothetical protein